MFPVLLFGLASAPLPAALRICDLMTNGFLKAARNNPADERISRAIATAAPTPPSPADRDWPCSEKSRRVPHLAALYRKSERGGDHGKRYSALAAGCADPDHHSAGTVLALT
jgi:hypothetical protein